MARPGAASQVGVGLIETMRVMGGRLPWLGRHLDRLHASIAALGGPVAPEQLVDRVLGGVRSGDSVVRLELTDGHSEISTRDVNAERDVALVVSNEPYHPYPHKTTRREQFGRALADARRRGSGASDALLVTPDGYVAEGTAWNLFWWEDGALCTPAENIGILPGLGRKRVMELTDVKEARVPVAALAGRSLFLTNAVRGIVEIGVFEGKAVPRDSRTAELAGGFWPVGDQD